MILYTAPLLSADECQILIDAFERHVDNSTERDFSGQPVIRWPFAGEHEKSFSFVQFCHHAAEIAVQDHIECVEFLDWLVETTILTRMGPGGWHEAHADNCRREGNEWVPNHTPHRTHTAIVYLSAPEMGGELYFPQHNVRVEPLPGHIVVFPADGEHEHGVCPVEAGYRYSLAMWLKAA